MSLERRLRIPLFPLAGALLFPRSQLPLHIFEPRYRAMIRDALSGEKLIGMVQPRPSPTETDSDRPALFDIGCLGRIDACEELPDGRFNVVLDGISRFRLLREVPADTLYRQVEAECIDPAEEDLDDVLASIQRADLEREARRYADALGYAVNWEAVGSLADEMLVNGIAQIAPLDPSSKQALLEADSLAVRADLLVQFMQFQRMLPGGADGPGTLQ